MIKEPNELVRLIEEKDKRIAELENIIVSCDERLDEFSCGYCALPATAEASDVPNAVMVALSTLRKLLFEARRGK